MGLRLLPNTTGKFDDPTQERVRKNIVDRIDELQNLARNLKAEIDAIDTTGGGGGAPSGTGLVRVTGGSYGARAELSGDVTTSGALVTTIAANAVTDARLRDSVGLSVIGRASNSTGDPADIVSGTDGTVLRRVGTVLTWDTSLTQLLASGVGFFGDGSDGALNFDGVSTVLGFVPSANVYTLSGGTRDVHASSIIVAAGVTIRVSGSCVFCTGNTQLDGTISAAGGNAVGQTAGAAAGGSSGGAGGNGGTFSSGAAGASGASGNAPFGFSTAAANGITGAGVNGGIGHGGAGGGNASRVGGNGGGVTVTIVNRPYLNRILGGMDMQDAIGGQLTPGSGGGGGAGGAVGGAATNVGGGGGGGGHIVSWASYTFSGSGTITATGGNGAAGGPATLTGGAGCGGAGGGGGAIAVAIWSGSFPTCVVTGGSAGAAGTGGSGIAGTAGGTGGDGLTYKFRLGY